MRKVAGEHEAQPLRGGNTKQSTMVICLHISRRGDVSETSHVHRKLGTELELNVAGQSNIII